MYHQGGFSRGSRGGGKPTIPPPPSSMPLAIAHQAIVPQKLAHGLAGTPIDLIANYYKFDFCDHLVYQYHVTITTEQQLRATSKDQEEIDLLTKTLEKTSIGEEEIGSGKRSGYDHFLRRFGSAIMRQFMADYGDRLFEEDQSAQCTVFDGSKALYSLRKLSLPPSEQAPVTVVLDEENQELPKKQQTFTVKLVPVGTLNLGDAFDFYEGKRSSVPPPVMHLLQRLFRVLISQSYTAVQTGQLTKYVDLKALISSGNRNSIVDFAPGFTASVRSTEFGLALNVHLKTSCVLSVTNGENNLQQVRNFPTSSCKTALTLILSLFPGFTLNGSPLSRRQLMEANRLLCHLRIFTFHTSLGSQEDPSKKRRVDYTAEGLSDHTAHFLTFTSSETGRKISIAEYFEQKYGIVVLPGIPLLKTTGGRRSHYLPLELCYLVPNQMLPNSKIGANIQRELLHKSTHQPTSYFGRLKENVEKIAATDRPLQEAFGLGLDTQPVAVKGRVLPPPRMLLKNEGSFKFKNPSAPGFFEPANPPLKWAVFCFDMGVPEAALGRFIGDLVMRARKLGLSGFGSSPPKPISRISVRTPVDLVNVFANLKKNCRDVELVFVALPINHPSISSSTFYSLVKVSCDQKVGIHSQCLQAANILNTPKGFLDNFLLKTNGRLGGRNVGVDLVPPPLSSSTNLSHPFKLNTMVVGVDVHHPGTQETLEGEPGRGKISVAAAVGTTNPGALTNYATSVRVQPRIRQEIVQEMGEMMTELLVAYKRANGGRLPGHVILFRDGVSDCQLATVAAAEVGLIRRAIENQQEDLENTVPVKLTVFVVLKRHHTRFVRQTASEPTGDYGKSFSGSFNVPSGTVVDQSIVEPVYRTFFLNSHYSRLGTSHPTKYVLLIDDLALSTDALQRLVYTLCHGCVRTRGLAACSLPVACRYAHLAAYRSKVHLEGRRALQQGKLGGNLTEEIRWSELIAEEDEPMPYDGFEEDGGFDELEIEKASLLGSLNQTVQIHEAVREKLYFC